MPAINYDYGYLQHNFDSFALTLTQFQFKFSDRSHPSMYAFSSLPAVAISVPLAICQSSRGDPVHLSTVSQNRARD